MRNRPVPNYPMAFEMTPAAKRYIWIPLYAVSAVCSLLLVASPIEYLQGLFGMCAFAAAIVAVTLLCRHFRLTRIEITETSLHLYTPGRFVSIDQSEFQSICRVHMGENLDRWFVSTKSGKSYSFNPQQFSDRADLDRALELWTTPLLKQRLQTPTFKTREKRNNVFVLLCVFLGILLTLEGQPLDLAAIALLLVLITLLVVFSTDYYEVNCDSLVHHAFRGLYKKSMALSEIQEIHLEPEWQLRQFKVFGPRKTFTINQTSLESDYPLLRDYLLLRATRARITGEADPSKLHLCTLPGPLEQLHDPAEQPKTEAQTGAPVSNETQ